MSRPKPTESTDSTNASRTCSPKRRPARSHCPRLTLIKPRATALAEAHRVLTWNVELTSARWMDVSRSKQVPEKGQDLRAEVTSGLGRTLADSCSDLRVVGARRDGRAERSLVALGHFVAPLADRPQFSSLWVGRPSCALLRGRRHERHQRSRPRSAPRIHWQPKALLRALPSFASACGASCRSVGVDEPDPRACICRSAQGVPSISRRFCFLPCSVPHAARVRCPARATSQGCVRQEVQGVSIATLGGSERPPKAEHPDPAERLHDDRERIELAAPPKK